jgi:membrane protease YdiL (CAAX protease family)
MHDILVTERDPLRAISQTGVFVLFYLLTITVMAMPLYWTGGQLVETTVTPLIGSIVATFLCWKIYDETPLPQAGLTPDQRGGRDLAVGIAAGIIAVAIALVPALLFRLAHFTPAPDGAHVTFNVTIFVTILIFCGAAGEEMLFHGFAFQSLMTGLGPFAAIFPVGVIFGLLHMGNPDATWLSTFNTIGFGIVFGYALYRTSGLWLPIGLHFGWNISLPFFGVKISGITMRVTGYEMTWNADPLLSGGAYGPEGSLMTTGVLALMLLFVWRYPFPQPAARMSQPVESEPAV